MRERISCTSSRSMLTLPEKALLVKLYYQNGECASAALRSYRHTKGIRRDDRPRSDRPSTRRNAAEMVKDEMETVAGVPSDAIRTKSIGIMNCYLAIP
ncbi:DUF4817 domain-containing protein [Trichonephila clavipes]|uniref:DUF4817 domain-containing protein n=1 Tax=Trichonephila clavipes TaxID=2585209 RepID=A0A8X6SYN1_TRICX|nr:DUF4817 domain-containing protein [Trichonephila clavipes]